MKNKALGKGLSALIPEVGENQEGLLNIRLDDIIENPFQPREGMDPDSLRELADSIRENGLIQPISVCRRDNTYQLISGARRLKASKIAGLHTIPALLVEITSDAELLELAIVENLQREDLNPMELAKGYQRLVEELGLTQEEVAVKVGKQRSTIANTLRLLKLPEQIQKSIKTGEFSAGHAKALLTVENPELQLKLYNKVLKDGLSVRALEKMVKIAEKIRAKPAIEKPSNPYLEDFESRLRQLLKTKVVINPKRRGGTIEINYYSDDDLDRLMDILESMDEL